jgi:hypothetical protein
MQDEKVQRALQHVRTALLATVLPKIISALPSRAAACASAQLPMALDSSGTLMFWAIAVTSAGTAPTMASPLL